MTLSSIGWTIKCERTSKKYKEGKIKNVSGLDLKVDRPTNPQITFCKKDSIKGIRWMTKEVIRLTKFNFK